MNDWYEAHDAVGLAELLRSGQVSRNEVLEAAIRRIEDRDAELNAVVFRRFEEALAEPPVDGPFSGVPFLLKDLRARLSGTPTTASSRYLQHFVPTADSTLVARYRAAGLVVLGKTNTPEFGLVAVTEPVWRGPTRNPWDPERTPGGSSGGSAAAVAAGYVPAAHGGDGGGSIRIPASACGLFGLRPSRGRNPLGPHMGESWFGLVQEHVLTRTVRDSAALLDVTAGPAPGEPFAVQAPPRPFLADVEVDPQPLSVALCTTPLFGSTMHPDAREAAESAAALLESLGHRVEPACPPFDRDLLVEAYLRIVATGLASDLEAAAEVIGRPPGPDDIEPVSRLLVNIGRTTRGDELARLLTTAHNAAAAMGPFFERYDVLVTPTLARPPVRIGELQPSRRDQLTLAVLNRLPVRKLLDLALAELAGEQMDPVPNTMLFNLTGQPAMSVPLHWNADGLPIGVQFVGRFGDEPLLFRLAGQLERARPWFDRRPPS